MSKPVLKVALVRYAEKTINLIDNSVCDIAFYRPGHDLTYAVCTFNTENLFPKSERPPFERMGNWSTAFPLTGGRFQRSFACLYRRWSSYVEMVEQLRKHFEIEEVKVE